MLRLEQGKEIKKKQFRSLHTLLLEMTDKFLQKSVECIIMYLVRFSIFSDRVVGIIYYYMAVSQKDWKQTNPRI